MVRCMMALSCRVLALIVGTVLGVIFTLSELNAPPTVERESSHNSSRWNRLLFYQATTLTDKPEPVDSNHGIIKNDKSVAPKVSGSVILPKPTPFQVDTSKLGEVVNPHDFHYTIDPKESCKDKDLFLVTYIHTSPDYLERRSIVRRTWANTTLYKNAKVRVFFVTGRPATAALQKALELEAKQHGDIIQENFLDTYHNLSIKAVGAMKWVTSRCKQAKFILKTDDDVFVNLFGLLPHLLDLDKYNVNNTGLLMCFVWHKMPVMREGKWKVLESVLPDKHYPTYCSGMAYVMTPDVAIAIYKTSAHVPFFWVDDVYITGTIPQVMSLKHVDIGRLVFDRNEVDWLLTGVDWYKYLFSHLGDINLFMAAWKTLEKRGLHEIIPKMPEVVAGKLGMKFGPKEPPDWFKKKSEAKTG